MSWFVELDGRTGGKPEWLLTGKGFFRGDELSVLKLIVVMVAHVCEYTKSHWIAHF